jgi:hypothetical protein
MRVSKHQPRQQVRAAKRAGPAPVPWCARLLAVLERRSLALALAAIAIGALRIAATYTELGVTFDEPAHLATGMQYLADGVYRYETQHPPLARAMDALGPYVAETRPQHLASMNFEGAAEIYQHGHPARTLALARLGALPFFVLAGLVVWLFSRDLAGKAPAALAAALFTLLPAVLAHGALATTDMALTACLGAAFYTAWVWVREPALKHTLLFGLATAGAAVSKFTSLGYFPAAVILALAFWVAIERPGPAQLAARARALALPFAIAAGTGAAAIWAVYRFSFGPVPGWHMKLPAPELFDGIRVCLLHYHAGDFEYFWGHAGNTGSWYFFPVALAVKTPIAFLALLGFGCYVCWTRRAHGVWRLPMALSLAILACGMTSRVNLGVRHVLPVYIGFSVVAGFGLCEMIRRGETWKPAGIAAAALALWMAATGAAVHPDYLAYFNAFAGSEPENILVDSDLDWGQETKHLADRLRELGVREVGFETMNLNDEQLAGWPGMPHTHPINPVVPTEGWTAVNPTFWKVGQYGLGYRYPNLRPWFEKLKPVERVGAVLLYYVPPGALRPAR